MKMIRNMGLKLTVSLLAVLLSGCVPVLIAAVGATAGGAIIYDKRSTQTILQDQEITNKVLSSINIDDDLKGSRVAITTFNHVVLVVGQVRTEQLRDQAYADVQRISGIRRIYNQLEVSPVSTGWDQSEDTWITSKVKTSMLTMRGLSSSQIKVVTENKVVYLMGLVTPNQGRLATEAARNVSNVRKVVQVFEYET